MSCEADALSVPVFRLELPLALAPTLNVYSNMKGWQRAKLRRALDEVIALEKAKWGAWDMSVRRTVTAQIVKGKLKKKTTSTGGRRRFALLERETSREPDEISIDICGGKAAIDRLVTANVLRDDSRKWLKREALWVPAKPGAGRVVISVFEVSA